MVDVGYCIDGKHGVIRNCEIHNYSDTMKYIRFKRGNEIYVIQYKEIEYIIPSDIECVSGKNLLPPNSMTNAEKFKEVFGFEVNRNLVEDVCSMVHCDIADCDECHYHDRYNWDDPYVKAED